MNKRHGTLVTVTLVFFFTLGTVTGLGLADDGNVEQRIAAFWARVNALQPNDYISSSDLGQWALNVIERDKRARLTVQDFRDSTAAMQAAFDRAGPAPIAGIPTPTPKPPTGAFTFGAGTKAIGTDVPAGTYRIRVEPVSSCYFARLSGFGGTINEIIANGIGSGRPIVTIAATDKGFNSQGCGTWSGDLSALTLSPIASFGGGMYIVGVDVAPGTWQSSGGTGSCYWARLSGFGATIDEIIANNVGAGPSIVQISASDRGFTSSSCGTWTKIG